MDRGAIVSLERKRPRVRWGLCCQFLDAPIRFRTATHRYVSTLEPARRRDYLAGIARDNAAALAAAVAHCRSLGIGAFRINSQILPLATHPSSGYTLQTLDPSGAIGEAFAQVRHSAAEADVRLSFHPDQFVVLNSEREAVVGAAVAELEYQAAVAELVGADTIVLHGGSTAGGTEPALDRLARGVERLSAQARSRLALENDDRHYAPADLLPICRRESIPLVYDVHHHRCRGDGLSLAEATGAAAETWRGRDPWAHISSPRDGWGAANPRPHADYVDLEDFPGEWRGLKLTVDVEAKAKERAVVALMSGASPSKAAAVPSPSLTSRHHPGSRGPRSGSGRPPASRT
ncbi:MAG: UV DNA damage repair endonuclease UvsE [Gemmatimonadales bacterium]|nr:UV DNA damage repair endonuclease UvsE [Gemmatimonadales bacterium]